MPELKVIISIIMTVSMIGYWIAAFTILYHLTRFGVGVQPKRFSAVFLFGSIVLFSAAIIAFVNIDFSTLALS